MIDSYWKIWNMCCT